MALNNAGLETGDLTEFDGNSKEGSNVLEASVTRANNGSYGLKVGFDGTNDEAYVYWNQTHTEYWGREYIYIDTITNMPQYEGLRIAQGLISTWEYHWTIGIKRVASGSGAPDRWFISGTGGIGDANSATNFVTGQWVLIEWHWKQGTGANGDFEVKIAGDTVFSDLGNDFTGISPARHEYGSPTATYAPALNDVLYFDDLAYDNTGWIGAAGGGGVSPVILQQSWRRRRSGLYIR